jgi:hypothetical protein
MRRTRGSSRVLGLRFIGQSDQFFERLRDLAKDADEAKTRVRLIRGSEFLIGSRPDSSGCLFFLWNLRDYREGSVSGPRIERWLPSCRIPHTTTTTTMMVAQGCPGLKLTRVVWSSGKSTADDTRAAMAKLERLVIGNQPATETEEREDFASGNEVPTEAGSVQA